MKSKILSFASIKLVLLAALFTGTSASAHAGGYHHYDRHYGGYGKHYRHDGYYRRGGGHYYKHRHRKHRYRRNRDRDIAYLAGGLLLGGIIVDAIHQNRKAHVVRERRVIDRGYDRHYGDASVSRHLHRDRYGNCFERTPNGDLIELPPSACTW